jgi:hypothetical protein
VRERGHAYNIFGLPFEPIPGGRQIWVIASSERKVPIKVPIKVVGSEKGSDKIFYFTD